MLSTVGMKAIMYNGTDKFYDYMDENALDMACEAALNEATYYGKNKYLLEIESIFQDICDDYQSRNQFADIADMCNDKRFDRVARLVEKCFGFKKCLLNASYTEVIIAVCGALNPRSSGASNAHTACTSHITKIARKVSAGGHRTEEWDIPGEKRKVIKMKDGANYNIDIFLHPTLFYNHGEDATLTGAEITAILCHEIGHNFYNAGPVRTSISLALDIVGHSIKGIVFGETIRTLMDMLNGVIPDNAQPAIRALVNFPHKVYGAVYSLFSPVFAVISTYNIQHMLLLMMKTADTINWPKVLASDVIEATVKYDDEKFADSFAAAYGYASEQYSALVKLGNIHDPGIAVSNKEIKTLNKVMNNIVAILRVPGNMIFWILDPHGGNEARMKNMLDYLEESNLAIDDPKLRKEYDQQLAEIRAVRESVRKPDNNMPSSIIKSAVVLIQDITNCSDVRDLISNIKPRVHRFANLDYTE